VVDFVGDHQAGIVTPAQDRLHLAVFDVVTDDRDALAQMLREWTAAAARMTRGLDAAPGRGGGSRSLPRPTPARRFALACPPDAHGGFGPSLFRDERGRDRFGLAGVAPAALAPLPPFRGDRLEPARSGGDLVVQACADDPQVAVHAVRNLARLARGVAVVRWSQLGFGRTSSTSTSQTTPRNLFGFKDGTANPHAEDADTLREHVWVQPGDGPAWMAGGSYSWHGASR
jgi:deferrochelatase/peroxidase EfeB